MLIKKFSENIKIRIKNHQRITEEHKFKNSPRYFKLDIGFIHEIESSRLNEKEAWILMKLILLSFKQRSDTIETTMDYLNRNCIGTTKELSRNCKTSTGVLNALISYNFIELVDDIIEYNKIKKSSSEENQEKETALGPLKAQAIKEEKGQGNHLGITANKLLEAPTKDLTVDPEGNYENPGKAELTIKEPILYGLKKKEVKNIYFTVGEVKRI